MVKEVFVDSAYALVLVYRFILQARVCVFRIGYFWFIVHGHGSTVQVLGPAMQGLGRTPYSAGGGLTVEYNAGA